MRNDKNLDYGYVYFIQCGIDGPIKIGYSKDKTAEARLTVAQVYNPVKLTLLCVIEGGRRKEQELHKLFKLNNIIGEWFKPTSELLNLIKEHPYLGLTVDDFRRPVANETQHYAWKGASATDYSKRDRAKRKFKIKPGDKCQECNIKDAHDRFHKDGDLNNNKLENVIIVCRSCCMKLDGRLETLRLLNKRPRGPNKNPRPTKPPQPCIICTVLSKPLRKGKCHACNEYYRRNGRERSEILNVEKRS